MSLSFPRARAAAPRPALLLADDPTVNLDGANRHATPHPLFPPRERHRTTPTSPPAATGRSAWPTANFPKMKAAECACLSPATATVPNSLPAATATARRWSWSPAPERPCLADTQLARDVKAAK